MSLETKTKGNYNNSQNEKDLQAHQIKVASESAQINMAFSPFGEKCCTTITILHLYNWNVP